LFSTTDTIAAIATPPGRGGLGVVRLSGPDAHAIVLRLLARSTPLEPRRATFGRIVAPSSREQSSPADARSARHVVDQVVVTWFAAPQSFTGDDVVEIGAHGSPVLLRQILELTLAQGARLGEPGEFTLRAHLNGRLDLVQAEAIADLVDAVTPLQARAAMDQLEGTLTTAIGRIDANLFDLAARLEASLDFPDEGFHFITRDEAAAGIAAVRRGLDDLARDGEAGRVLREGSLVVITGRPNAGKSSLFNALAGAARAIVTDVPGTTRDLLTERVEIGGVPITLVDTAGLREARDVIEAEGVRRAKDALRVAALTLHVVDATAGARGEDDDFGGSAGADLPGPCLRVLNKIDLLSPPAGASPQNSGADGLAVSARTGVGLSDLRHAMLRALTAREDLRDPPAISNLRHLGHVHDALAAVDRAEEALGAGATEELVLAELSAARGALEAITGRRSPEDLLRHIFSRFCIGK
jgi:tRNA modification GTPase